MPDRKKQPAIKTINNFKVKKAEKQIISGSPVYILNAGDQDIIKTDFIFEAGKIYDKNPLIALSVNSLIDKGTNNLTSEQIAEKLDFYGAYYETEITKYHSIITLYTLNKYFEETFNIVSDFLFNAVFPENEINIYLKNRLQTFKINRQKTDVRSWETFNELLFGKEHPYGRNLKEYDFTNTDRSKIVEFYRQNYTTANMTILISGKVNDKHLKLTEKFLGAVEKSNKKKNNIKVETEIKAGEKKRKFVKIEDTVQYSVKIGNLSINKAHPDFFNLKISTIILGGYFGSRLMSNIREDKGYTYGIYAGNFSAPGAGYFFISAESGKEVYREAVDEIYKELKILRTIPVKNDELDRVKKWIYGNAAKTFDGPLATSEACKMLITGKLSENYFLNYIEAVKKINSETILETAQKYLNENSMIEVVAGA